MQGEVVVANREADRTAAFDVRHAVFVEEQGVPEDVEWDEHDEGATHLLARDADGRAVGAARFRPYPSDGGDGSEEGSSEGDAAPPRTAKVERVAVLPDRRGEGWGRRLMDAVERQAAEEGFDRLKLHSQTHAAEFYRRLNYTTVGEEFEEAGIPHVAMTKDLTGGEGPTGGRDGDGNRNARQR